ncbi:unnamed protein product [Adineta ricciae]|uniref:Exocyst complex component 7 n=1 Tax=Adineta ricciae TaxID=249248 RepID=A0A814IPQ0_ADIRI|nr:unnamed protein product [Adineta ricciae]
MTGGSNTKMNTRSSEVKLQEEKRRLELLQESLSRSNALTSGMVSTLDNFERKLQSLDELVTPVYEATNELHLLLNNVDQSLSLVDSVLHYYDICEELTTTVSSGPGGNLTDYLGELGRLEDAVRYFKRTEATRERERVLKLFDLGRKRLVEETDKLILRYANPLQPKETLDLVETYAKNTTDLHAMQEADMRILQSIIEWFNSHGFKQGLIDSYATKRGTMIRRSLQLLAEHLGKTSVRRISTVATSSPSLSQKSTHNNETLKRQGTKISDMGRRLMRTSAHSTGSRGNNSSLSSSTTTLEENTVFDSNDDRETNNYKLLLDAFIVLLQRDRDLLNYVFMADLQSLVFTKLIELPLVYMREEAQSLCESIERSPRKIDMGKFAIYGIFSILRWFLRSRPVFAKLYQESDVARRQQFTTLSATFEQSAVACLRGILEEITTDSSPRSQGGNVHPLTSHVLAFMEGLLAYEDTATIIASRYVEQQQQRSSSGGASGTDKGLYDLGTYFAQLVRALHITLSKKSDDHNSRNDATMRAVFLLNNVNYLLKRLENSPLLALLQRCQPDLKSKYEADFQTSLRDFTKCYTPLVLPIQQMLEYDNNHHIPDGKLRDRDREQLKESFAAVNAAIDSIRQQFSQFIISDVDLRDRLRSEGKAAIIDLYKRYYSKFAHKDFTKNRDKYVRYEPRAFEIIIENSF